MEDLRRPGGTDRPATFWEEGHDPFDDLDMKFDDPIPVDEQAEAEEPPDAPEALQATGVTYFAVARLLAVTAERLCNGIPYGIQARRCIMARNAAGGPCQGRPDAAPLVEGPRLLRSRANYAEGGRA